jgi:hypothetical protein
VQDAGGQTVGCFISANSEETARQAKVLTRDGARRMAVNCARLPELLGRTSRHVARQAWSNNNRKVIHLFGNVRGLSWFPDCGWM